MTAAKCTGQVKSSAKNNKLHTLAEKQSFFLVRGYTIRTPNINVSWEMYMRTLYTQYSTVLFIIRLKKLLRLKPPVLDVAYTMG